MSSLSSTWEGDAPFSLCLCYTQTLKCGQTSAQAAHTASIIPDNWPWFYRLGNSTPKSDRFPIQMGPFLNLFIFLQGGAVMKPFETEGNSWEPKVSVNGHLKDFKRILQNKVCFPLIKYFCWEWFDLRSGFKWPAMNWEISGASYDPHTWFTQQQHVQGYSCVLLLGHLGRAYIPTEDKHNLRRKEN